MRYTLLDDNNGRYLVQVQDDHGNECWIPRERYAASLTEKRTHKNSRPTAHPPFLIDKSAAV